MNSEEKFLNKLYKEIPTFTCIEGCTDCCGPVFTTKTEAAKLGIQVGSLTNLPGNPKCQFAGESGCTVHDKRPLMCRVMGATTMESLQCPHGKGPLKKMKDQQTVQLISRYKTFVIMDANLVKHQIGNKQAEAVNA